MYQAAEVIPERDTQLLTGLDKDVEHYQFLDSLDTAEEHAVLTLNGYRFNNPCMSHTTQMVYVHKFIAQIGVHVIAVTLQRLQLSITDKLRLYVSATSAMLLIAVLVFRILIEEDDDTDFHIDQTPHVSLAFLIYGTVAQARFVYIYVCTLA